MPGQPSTFRRLRPSIGNRSGRCATKFVPSELTDMHPPCNHRAPTDPSIAFAVSTTLRQQYLTWVGIECRPLRAQQDSVSTVGRHQRFTSPFHPSRQLDQKRCQNLPETGVLEMLVKKWASKSHALYPIPRPIRIPPPRTFVHPSTSNGISE